MFMNDCNARYYRKMEEIRYATFYWELYLENSIFWNRGCECGAAIFTLGGVGAWTFWAQCSTLWAIIIAVAQILSVVRIFSWRPKRIELLSKILPDFQKLANFAEEHWGKIAKGRLTEEEIESLIQKLNHRREKIENEIRPIYVPERKKFIRKANQKANQFLDYHFHN